LPKPPQYPAKGGIDGKGNKENRFINQASKKPTNKPIKQHKKEKKMKKLIRFFKEEDGVTAIEYGLIAALIAVAIISAVGLVGTNLNNVFKGASDKLVVT
jgi:pilus assembly protein Flp/PilA